MKKFYTLIATAVLGVATVSAADLTVTSDAQALGLQKANVTLSAPAKAPAKTLGGLALRSGLTKIEKAETSSTMQKAPAKAPESGWESVGEGTWVEDFMTVFGDVPSGQTWTVNVEKSGDWYRCLPYADGSFIANLMGAPDNSTYFYINATNPDKVYFEDFIPYESFFISCIVPECEWDVQEWGNVYGTFKDNVFNFPEYSSGININGWYLTCQHSGTYLVLPGGEVPYIPDYSFDVTAPTCADNNNFVFDVLCGRDVASFSLMLVGIPVQATANNLAIVAANGQSFESATNAVTFSPNADSTPEGQYYILCAALDKDGNVVGGDVDYFFVNYEVPEEWASVGTLTFSEPFLSKIYQDIDEAEYSVACEENVKTPGLYRLVNIYDNHPQIGLASGQNDKFNVGHGHNHYVYIDATDPQLVLVKASPVGVDLGYGDIHVGDIIGYFLSNGVELDVITDAGYEPATFEDDLMIFPEGTLYMAEKEFEAGEPQQVGEAMLDFSEVAGVSNVKVDNAAGEIEYFNLQGIRVNNPENGVYIRRQGGEAKKVYVK